MASLYVRMLDARVLTANYTPERDEVVDAGAYNTLHFDCRVLKLGTGGNVLIDHAAVNEPDAYRPLTSATWSCITAGSYVAVSGFLRYVRVRTDGGVTGAPIVTLDRVADKCAG